MWVIWLAMFTFFCLMAMRSGAREDGTASIVVNEPKEEELSREHPNHPNFHEVDDDMDAREEHATF